MKRIQLLLIVLALSALVLTLHLLALNYFLYWRIWWFDIPVHFLGGFTVALFSIVPVVFSEIKDESIITVGVVSAIVLAILWEIFEYKIGLSRISSKFYSDTVSDLSSGVIGGFCASWLAQTFIHIESRHE